MPWGTISNEKIIDKWASKYGIKINIVQLNDYIESINQYTAGQFDGCTMTNMDALTIPAAGGVDSTALITGSYSDGNDGVVLKGADKKLSDLKGMSVYLPELSVSHYLLVRGLEKAGLQEKDVKVVNTQTLKDNPALGKALTGAWFEMMAKMKAGDSQALSAMAADSGTDLAGYQAQLKTTHLFWTPADTLAFISSPDLAKTMQRVAQFSFDKGLLGEGAQSADFIGMTFPGNVTLGDADTEADQRRDGQARQQTAQADQRIGPQQILTAAFVRGERHPVNGCHHLRQAWQQLVLRIGFQPHRRSNKPGGDQHDKRQQHQRQAHPLLGITVNVAHGVVSRR